MDITQTVKLSQVLILCLVLHLSNGCISRGDKVRKAPERRQSQYSNPQRLVQNILPSLDQLSSPVKQNSLVNINKKSVKSGMKLFKKKRKIILLPINPLDNKIVFIPQVYSDSEKYEPDRNKAGQEPTQINAEQTTEKHITTTEKTSLNQELNKETLKISGSITDRAYKKENKGKEIGKQIYKSNFILQDERIDTSGFRNKNIPDIKKNNQKETILNFNKINNRESILDTKKINNGESILSENKITNKESILDTRKIDNRERILDMKKNAVQENLKKLWLTYVKVSKDRKSDITSESPSGIISDMFQEDEDMPPTGMAKRFKRNRDAGIVSGDIKKLFNRYDPFNHNPFKEFEPHPSPSHQSPIAKASRGRSIFKTQNGYVLTEPSVKPLPSPSFLTRGKRLELRNSAQKPQNTFFGKINKDFNIETSLRIEPAKKEEPQLFGILTEVKLDDPMSPPIKNMIPVPTTNVLTKPLDATSPTAALRLSTTQFKNGIFLEDEVDDDIFENEDYTSLNKITLEDRSFVVFDAVPEDHTWKSTLERQNLTTFQAIPRVKR